MTASRCASISGSRHSIAYAGMSSAGLIGRQECVVVRRLGVEASEYGLCCRWDVGRFVVVPGEGPNMIKRIEDHHCREFNFIIKITSKQVGAVVSGQLTRRNAR